MKTVFFAFSCLLALTFATPTLRGSEEELDDGGLLVEAPSNALELALEGEMDFMEEWEPRELRSNCAGEWFLLYTKDKNTGKYLYWKAKRYYVKGYYSYTNNKAFYWKKCGNGKIINKAYSGYALSWSGYKKWLKLVHYSYGKKWYYDKFYRIKTHGYCADLYRDYYDYYHLNHCYKNWYDQMHYWYA